MDRLILSAMENGTEKSALLRAQLAARSSMPIPPAEVTAASPSAMKVGLFRKLFSGRTDVFPIRWENSGTGRSGYAAACQNEWVCGVCEKPRVK